MELEDTLTNIESPDEPLLVMKVMMDQPKNLKIDGVLCLKCIAQYSEEARMHPR